MSDSMTTLSSEPKASSLNANLLYTDIQGYRDAIQQIESAPELVTVAAIQKLKQYYQQAINGQCFILQAGDCAERFEDASEKSVVKRLETLEILGQLISSMTGLPTVHVGRMAGQYAKPRTTDTETQKDLTLSSYRGDLINDAAFNETARTPNPLRLERGYHCAKKTYQHIEEYCKKHASNAFFTCHESLHLGFERALTRNIAGEAWNVSTHMPWVGLRSNHDGSEHLNYAAEIANPIGLKIGPDFDETVLLATIEKLTQKDSTRPVALIYRFGYNTIERELPRLFNVVQKTSVNVLYISDPMHGNTTYTQTKPQRKIRTVSAIIEELTLAKKIHEKHDLLLHGLHLEVTAEQKLECADTVMTPMDALSKPLVDPRLNLSQAKAVCQVLESHHD